MVYNVYCMRDLKAGFLQPTIEVNDASAIRNFDTAIKRSGDVLHFHPEDFQLYKIASFNLDNGKISPVEPIELVSEGVDHVEK